MHNRHPYAPPARAAIFSNRDQMLAALFPKLAPALDPFNVRTDMPKVEGVVIKPMPHEGKDYILKLTKQGGPEYQASVQCDWPDTEDAILARFKRDGVCYRIARTGAPQDAQLRDLVGIATQQGIAMRHLCEDLSFMRAQHPAEPDVVWLFIRLPE